MSDDESPKKKTKRKCICNRDLHLGEITGIPPVLPTTEINEIRLNLFTERNSDNSGYLVLKGLDIWRRYGRRIQDSDIRAICLYVRESPRRITKLDLSYNEITDTGFYKLLKKLLIKERSSIINFNIMNNNITEKSIKYLSNYASMINLKYLRLNGNPFGKDTSGNFSQFLIKNKSVEFLDIGQSDQTLTTVAQIITALRLDHGGNTTVKVFDMNRIIPVFNRYPIETKWLAYHIEYLLERNKTILELRLQKNQFIGHDMEYFVRGLRRNNTLLYLDLSDNRIGEYGIELLSEYLRGGTQLLLLNVAGNDIKNGGAKCLSYCLPFSKIRALDISRNKISDIGILEILHSMQKPYSLKYFYVWGNLLCHKGCLMIKRLLDIGILQQDTIDIQLYESGGRLHAAYYRTDRSKHFYYSETDYSYAPPIYHIKRNKIQSPQKAVEEHYEKHLVPEPIL